MVLKSTTSMHNGFHMLATVSAKGKHRNKSVELFGRGKIRSMISYFHIDRARADAPQCQLHKVTCANAID